MESSGRGGVIQPQRIEGRATKEVDQPSQERGRWVFTHQHSRITNDDGVEWEGRNTTTENWRSSDERGRPTEPRARKMSPHSSAQPHHHDDGVEWEGRRNKPKRMNWGWATKEVDSMRKDLKSSVYPRAKELSTNDEICEIAEIMLEFGWEKMATSKILKDLVEPHFQQFRMVNNEIGRTDWNSDET